MKHLKARIERAFPTVPIPRAPILDTYDDENIIPTFLGRTWDSFTVQDLRDHSAAIGLLNTNAFVYYLPAFVIASIDDPEVADVIPGNLLSMFGAEDASELTGRLNEEQRDLLVEFFSSYVGDDPCLIRPLADALDNLKPGWNEGPR